VDGGTPHPGHPPIGHYAAAVLVSLDLPRDVLRAVFLEAARRQLSVDEWVVETIRDHFADVTVTESPDESPAPTC
jgi:predicted HicB family RNase H-like nuclease